jgi:hypothetical protein
MAVYLHHQLYIYFQLYILHHQFIKYILNLILRDRELANEFNAFYI